MTEKMKFRFLGCEGFALQADCNIKKITDGIYNMSTDASVIYLLTGKGDVKCSIPTIKSNYESFENQDRRQLNDANGFNVLWDNDSPICTIYYRSKKDGCGWSVISSILCVFIGCFIGWMFTYYTLDSSSDAITDITELQNNNQLLKEQNDSVKKLIIELQKQKDSVENKLSFAKEKDCSEKEILSSRKSFNDHDVLFLKSLFLKVNRHSFYSYLAITNTLIGEGKGSLSTKKIWLTNPQKFYFKIRKSENGVISGQYSVDGGLNYSNLTINGNSRDINDVSQYTYLLFDKMGVLKEFEAKGWDAIKYINERSFFVNHKE